jgi:hypothetical protein
MGQTTPAIGIYIPAAGEDGYDQSFSQGMINVDQHDHSGGPNKGLPIATQGLGDFSVTFDKLNANVVDPTTGIGTSGTFPNQLVLLDPIKSIFQLAPLSVGFLTLNGTVASARTFQNSATVTWTNANGTGNPQANVNIAGLTPVNVANGGTGRTTLSAYDVLLGGTTTTNPVQQVSGQGTLNQYLGSNGASAIPSWKTLPVIPAQTLFQSTVTITAAQFRNLSGTPIQIVPALGAGTVIVPVSALGKVTVSTLGFAGGSSVRFYYGATSFEAAIRFDSGAFDEAFSAYYQAVGQTVSTAGIPLASMENVALFVSVNGADFTSGGASTTVDITVFYNAVAI